MRSLPHLALTVAATSLAFACGQSPNRTIDPPPTHNGPTPNYFPEIAQIVQDRCLNCHKSDGVAPFALETFDDVSSVGAVLETVVMDRSMPPWGVDNSGDCQTYDDARWLNDDEMAKVAAWLSADMPMGNPDDKPAAPQPQPTLQRIDDTLDMVQQYTPGGTSDDYRCFIVEPNITTDKFLTGYEVKPGDERVVHHVVVFAPQTDEAARQVRASDAAEAGPGYSCFGGVGAAADFIIAWAPGTPATKLPAGTGLKVVAGRPLVMQVHYNVLSGTFPDRTTIDLELADTVAREGFMSAVVDTDMRLPGGQASTEFSFTEDVGADVDVFGVFPHMHTLGRTMRIELESGTSNVGNSGCMMNVPRWDFDWQQFYIYDQPLRLDNGGRVKVTCTYDTRGRDFTTTFGERTQDEMCVAVMYYAFR